MKTIVYRLGTNNKYIYTLPPEKAVVCAYCQYGKRNFNTWEYDYSLVKYSATAKTVYCGDFAARVMDARDYLFEKHLQDDDEIALAAFLRGYDHEEEGGHDEQETQ